MESHVGEKREIVEQIEEEEEEESSALKEVFLFLKDLAISFAVILLLTTFVIRPVKVKGSSMYPTLEDAEIGFSNLIGMKLNHLKRFDIVIIHLADRDEYLVKRLIGMPGDTIEVNQDVLYINGEPVKETYLDEEYKASEGPIFTGDIAELTLGENEYYCLGDNRPHSTDSRVYGPFQKEQIISKGIFVLFPFNHFGFKTW
ncbi:MAG: signal peptidase I [Solobacterium sp.]|nr:signal peptidase I [Solobacterium sp.]